MTNPCPASRSSDLFGQHFLSIGIPFIDLAFAILARLDGIVERGLNLLRGLHVLNSHGADLNSRLVFIEQFLDSFLDVRRHFGAARIQTVYPWLLAYRSDERRVGQACVSNCRSRWSRGI